MHRSTSSLPSRALTDRPFLDDDGRLVLFLAGHRTAAAVRLLQEVRRPRDEPAFTRVAGGWRARVDPGPVDRLEYRIAIISGDGGTVVVTDPHNPDTVANPFGERSVWTRPGVTPPAWTHSTPARRGTVSSHTITGARADAPLAVIGWTHPDLDPTTSAPLLVVHDGPAFVEEAGFGLYLDHLAADASVAPFRAAMLGTDTRSRDYSASPAYAATLVDELVPQLTQDGPHAAPTDAVVGVGASLGALAHLHAAVTHPGTYAALLLQSGSYFRPDRDEVESGFAWFERVTRFTDRLVADPPPPGPLATLTCGLVEENLGNNEEVTRALADAGWTIDLVRHRDAHNLTSWRDVWDPHLRELLRATSTAR